MTDTIDDKSAASNLSQVSTDFLALLTALREHGRKHPTQWVIPGWDGHTISRTVNEALTGSADTKAGKLDPFVLADGDAICLVGIKDGKETPLGRVPLPPEIKLRDIMRTYFGGDPNDGSSDVALAVAGGMEFWKWATEKAYRRFFMAPAGHEMRFIPEPLTTETVRQRIEGRGCVACHACLKNKVDAWGAPVTLSRMIVCPDCGYKRCPKAADHSNACTSSNEPGQLGSAYPKNDGFQKSPNPRK